MPLAQAALQLCAALTMTSCLPLASARVRRLPVCPSRLFSLPIPVCRLAWAVFFLVLSLGSTGCGEKGRSPGTATDAPSAQTSASKILRVGNGAEPQDLDPQAVSGEPEHKIASALFEGLVTDARDGRGVAPGVAATWDISPDGLTYTFQLRAEARWSNGEPVTATDFLTSYRRMLSPAYAAEYASMLYPLAGAEAFNTGRSTDFSQVGVAAPTPRTLVLTLHSRTPYLLEALKHNAWFPIHPATVQKYGDLTQKGTAWTRPGNLVGNGPFELVEWRPRQRITVRRSPTYWDRAQVGLDAIEFHAVESLDTEERMFRTGQLDYIKTLPLSKIEVYRSTRPEVYHQSVLYGTYFYRLNTTQPPLNDVRVRRALALAIDREALVANVTRGGQSPAYHFTPPSAKFTSRSRLDAAAPTQDARLVEARRLLAAAGFPEGRGFPVLSLLYNTQEGHRAIAEAIQQMWRAGLGVDISLRNEDWKVFQESCQLMNYQIARSGWNGDYDDPHTFVSLLRGGDGNNQTGFHDAEYDRLLAAAIAAPDDAARFELYQKLEEILTRELPVIPIYYYTRTYLLNPAVLNWVDTPLDQRGWKWIDLAPATPAR